MSLARGLLRCALFLGWRCVLIVAAAAAASLRLVAGEKFPGKVSSWLILQSHSSSNMADSQEDKLYKAEYAKSGRASCKKCKENIAKDSLRMAIMVQVKAVSCTTLAV